jgi:hypothetical protein
MAGFLVIIYHADLMPNHCKLFTSKDPLKDWKEHERFLPACNMMTLPVKNMERASVFMTQILTDKHIYPSFYLLKSHEAMTVCSKVQTSTNSDTSAVVEDLPLEYEDERHAVSESKQKNRADDDARAPPHKRIRSASLDEDVMDQLQSCSAKAWLISNIHAFDRVSGEEVYDMYLAWAKENEHTPLNRYSFASRLSAVMPFNIKTSKINFFKYSLSQVRQMVADYLDIDEADIAKYASKL